MLLGVDVGGTFTDGVLLGEHALHIAKVPTTPEDPARGVLAVVEQLIARAGVGPADIRRFAHGMTVATNALLEGRGARTALVATEGFTDVAELGRQARVHLYRLCQSAPPPLVPAELRFGAPERMGPDGPLLPLAEEAANQLVEALARAAPQAIAVSLLHSYAHPAHEDALGALIRERLPGVHLSLSHELVGTFREYERTATTEVDAALSPLLGAYLERLSGECSARGLPAPEVMQSSGGLSDTATAGSHAARTVLSGPAGGVRGALTLAALAGYQDVLCLDMGGTSCDVCLIEGGRLAEAASRSVAGRPLALPSLDIHTVGAGGGSIAWRDPGGALRVGPQSAGAVPGPACYGRGGTQPTVTDANLLLGRLPAGLELAGGVRLDHAAAARAVGALAAQLGLSERECADGIVRVAEAGMVRALKVITVQRGVDPRDFALMCFGGGGPLHAAAIARELGMSRIICPRASGVLCALGLAVAPPRRDVSRTVMLSGDAFTAERLTRERELLSERARAELGGSAERIEVRYELRYRGQSFELPVLENRAVQPEVLAELFAAAHEERYGYREPGAAVELVTIRVSAIDSVSLPDLHEALSVPRGPGMAGRSRAVWEGREIDVQHLKDPPPAGSSLAGPAVCALPGSTLFVAPGWSGRVDGAGTVTLEHGAPVRRRTSGSPGGDPIELEVMGGALRSACEEMGAALIRAAHSANIKERRDASTALFSERGEMVMQAEHIPVHLGAMPGAVAAVGG
ncbi:MAG: hydantoinase/oxoprolinase family protein, partial [Solirubrobacteraceae bacterium]